MGKERSIVLSVPSWMLLTSSSSNINSAIVYVLGKMLRSSRMGSTRAWAKIFLDSEHGPTVWRSNHSLWTGRTGLSTSLGLDGLSF